VAEFYGSFPGAMGKMYRGNAYADDPVSFRTTQSEDTPEAPVLTDWAQQGLLQICRWLPGRQIIFIGDSSFAVHTLAAALTDSAILVPQLRLDDNLFAAPAKRHEHTPGRPAQKSQSLPKLKPVLKDPKTQRPKDPVGPDCRIVVVC